MVLGIVQWAMGMPVVGLMGSTEGSSHVVPVAREYIEMYLRHVYYNEKKQVPLLHVTNSELK